MFKGLRGLVLAGGVAIVSLVSEAHELEDLISGVESFESFYQDSALRDRYLRLAQRRYGGERAFSRESFERVLDVMYEVVSRDSDLSRRLWSRKHDGHPVQEIELSEPVYEQDDLVVARALTRLSAEFERLKRHGDSSSSLESRYRELESLQGASLETRADYRALVSAILAQAFEVSEVGQLLVDGRLGTLSERFDTWAQNPDFVLQAVGLPRNERLRLKTHLRREIQRVKALFPRVEVGVGRLRFEEELRPFHAALFSIFAFDCVGGSCFFLNSTHAERLLVPLLEGVRTVLVSHVSRQNQVRVQGFVQYVPGTLRGRSYVSLTLSAPILATEIGGGHTLFSRWWDQAHRTLVSTGNAEGFLLSRSLSFEREAMLARIHRDPLFLNAEVVGSGAEFQIQDHETAARIVALSPTGDGNALLYVDNMITEATIPGSSFKPLFLLKASDGERARTVYQDYLALDSMVGVTSHPEVSFLNRIAPGILPTYVGVHELRYLNHPRAVVSFVRSKAHAVLRAALPIHRAVQCERFWVPLLRGRRY